MRIRPLYAGIGLATGAGVVAAACERHRRHDAHPPPADPAANTATTPLLKTATLSVSGQAETLLTDAQ